MIKGARSFCRGVMAVFVVVDDDVVVVVVVVMAVES